MNRTRRVFTTIVTAFFAFTIAFSIATQPATVRADEETNTPTPTPCVTRTPGPTPTPTGLGGGDPDHGFC